MTPRPGIAGWALLVALLSAGALRGDGKLFRPRPYTGSLEESSQEAIIIFNASDKPGGSFQDLILKIDVKGRTDKFAWVIPFPQEPTAEKEDGRLFEELHHYVEMRNSWRDAKPEDKGAKSEGLKDKAKERPVEVLSRRVVGSYDVAVVRENESGALGQWLTAEGYEPLPEGAEDVIGFYRRKHYVFACVKVKDAATGKTGGASLHPLRFSFRTGGYDGIYFPMKMSGLQAEPFNVNLYVFYRYWINDKLSKFGYVHRGFSLRYRDWDSRECEANGGKSWSAPEEDPFLRSAAYLLPTVTKLFQKLYPGERYYLTNIQANGLLPSDVRQWSDDLWLFPYRTGSGWVPYDVRDGGIASAAWPNVSADDSDEGESAAGAFRWWALGAAVLACLAVGAGLWWLRGRRA